MTVQVHLPALLADRIDGISRVEVPGQTVSEVLHALADRHPELRALVLGPDGEVSVVMVVFLNDTQLSPGELLAPVTSGDTIEIIPAIEGG